MSDIVKNYIELGFGSPTIDFDDSLYSPIQNKQVSNHGFSSEELILEDKTYKNYKDFNFGSKDVSIFQNEIKYTYKDLSEEGFLSIEANSYKDLKIKNRLIYNPTISYNIRNNVFRVDSSIWLEKINSKNYKIHNFSNKKVEINYTAFSNTIKKETININQNRNNNLNKKIKNSLQDIQIQTPKYYTSKEEEDIANFSSSPGAEDFDTIQYGLHNRFINYNISGLFDLTNPEIEYFSLETPNSITQRTTIAAMFDKKTYELTDPNDLTTKQLKTLPSPIGNWTYGIDLQPSTNYYYWIEDDGNWYYSTSSFPSVIEYI